LAQSELLSTRAPPLKEAAVWRIVSIVVVAIAFTSPPRYSRS
jgi:hypothetical protein